MKYDSLSGLADMMENFEPGSPERKEIAKEYSMKLKEQKLPGEDFRHSVDEIRRSRKSALTQIENYLYNIDYWRVKLPQMQTGEIEYIAVSCLTNYKGMACEMNLEIPNITYSSISGAKCYKAIKNLFFVKQLCNYGSIEQGLIKFGMDLLHGEEKKKFFEKYAVPYNAKIKNDSKRD